MHTLLAAIGDFGAIAFTVVLVIGVAGGMLAVAHLLGPKARAGRTKDSPYESGMPIIGGTQQRFHIRFYIVAMLFLLFDVELLFLYPWALAFHSSSVHGVEHALEGVASAGNAMIGREFLAVSMGMFFLLLVFGLIYEWKKGAFQWD